MIPVLRFHFKLRYGLRLILLILWAVLSISFDAYAGAFAPCKSPIVYSGAAVNVIVLPYESVTPETYHSKSANRLAALIQMDTLFSLLKYRSLGVTALSKLPKEKCEVEQVIGKVTGAGDYKNYDPQIKSRYGLVVLSGQIYQEGETIYMQSFIDFLRRDVREEIKFNLPDRNSSVSFSAVLPSQQIAFPPHAVTREELLKFDKEFNKIGFIHDSPDSQKKTPLNLSPGQPFAYYLTAVQGEWMKVEPHKWGGRSGWIHAGTKSTKRLLRKKIPELYMLEAVFGYLRFRTGWDSDSRLRNVVKMSRNALSEFERNKAAHNSDSLALAKSLDGMLQILAADAAGTDKAVRQAEKLFRQAVQMTPYNAEMLNLYTTANIYLWGIAKSGKLDTVDGIVRSLQKALMLSPRNDRILANIENFYGLLLSDPRLKEKFATPKLKKQVEQIHKIRTALK